MDLEDIQQILALLREHDLAELEIEKDGLKVKVRKASGAAPVVSVAAPVAQPAPAPAPVAGAVAPDAPALADEAPGIELSIVTSPIVGTFYRSSEPGARSFVEVGDRVAKGQVICIIEAMKLMNEIEAEMAGEVVKIHPENGQPVQYGDSLFTIRPA